MFCLDGHKAALRRGVDELQKGPNSAEGRQALEEVLELAAALVALPDPAHALEAAVVAAKHSAGAAARGGEAAWQRALLHDLQCSWVRLFPVCAGWCS